MTVMGSNKFNGVCRLNFWSIHSSWQVWDVLFQINMLEHVMSNGKINTKSCQKALFRASDEEYTGEYPYSGKIPISSPMLFNSSNTFIYGVYVK